MEAVIKGTEEISYKETPELSVIVETNVKLRWIFFNKKKKKKLYKILGIRHVKVFYKKVLLVACLLRNLVISFYNYGLLPGN